MNIFSVAYCLSLTPKFLILAEVVECRYAIIFPNLRKVKLYTCFRFNLSKPASFSLRTLEFQVFRNCVSISIPSSDF